MKKAILLIATCTFLLTALSACNTERNVIGQKTNIPDNVKALIYVTDTGDITILDTKGEELKTCVLPTPDTDKEEAVNCCDVCEGLDKGSAVTNIQMLSIMKTNSAPCVYVFLGKDSNGTPQYAYICW